MPTNEQHRSHILSTYFAPRGRNRIFTLGMQLAQLYLSPFDHIIGIIGEAGSGKSVLIKGMFPGLELTNDDDGVNVRPLPLLEQDMETGFFSPHTYHLDIRFEMGFHQMTELADGIRLAVHRGKRVIVEHFDLIYPILGHNADLLIGVGEEIVVTRPNIFGPEPQQIYNMVYQSLPYRLMAHTAEDLCEFFMPEEDMRRCFHDDVRHGFILAFPREAPQWKPKELEAKVLKAIEESWSVDYQDESHIRLNGTLHRCTGPRTHVRTTGQIKGFCLLDHFVYDRKDDRYLMVGCVGEDTKDSMERLDKLSKLPQEGF